MQIFAEKGGSSPKNKLDALLAKLHDIREHDKLSAYRPYEYQLAFHNAKGSGTDVPARQRALQAANKTGKSYCGAREAAFHATGLYPDWYQGVRFDHPTEGLVASVTMPLTRDVAQKELVGDLAQGPDALGTGAIPRDLIVKTYNKPGVPNALDSIIIRHVSGGTSKAMFQSYEAGFSKFQGFHTHWAWCDEEPPMPIWEQVLRSGFATNGIAFLTYTPEQGITDVVHGFLYLLQDTQALVTATWDDVSSEQGGHMTPEMRESFLSAIPAHQRDMRTKGIPGMGTGVIFDVDDDHLMYDPFEYPRHWPRIAAMDYGSDHPFAGVWAAVDTENDTFYLYDVYRESRATMPTHAAAFKRRGLWIPVAWPADVNQTDAQSGKPLSEIYRNDYGLNMLPLHFTNPPGPGQKEGQGGRGIEVGLAAMLTAMQEGRFKVARHLKPWFEEKSMYQRTATADGRSKVRAIRDDLMSATRYAYMSQRFACVQPMGRPRVRRTTAAPLRNWG